MTSTTTLDDFLKQNRISPETWEKSALEWSCLREIAEDHNSQEVRLRDTAELFARTIQRFSSVHSVRWRIKDTEHLLEKIVRKRADSSPKYSDISHSNYFEIVTDLIGLRALHLFKDDCFSIDSDLRKTWTPSEQPTAYVRMGDPQNLTNRFREEGFDVKEHPAGYRSIHYVFGTQPLHRKIFAEIQVRTIFEEGWSEIDHRVRYPNFTNDQLVDYFLAVFNRLAGSADEMGTFVQGLTRALQASDLKLTEANRKKEEALSAMDRMLTDIEKMKQQDASTNEKLTSLQKELAKLRKITSATTIVGGRPTNILASLAGLETSSLASDLGKASAISDALRITSASEKLMKSAESSITLDFLEKPGPLASLADLEISRLASDLGKALAISDALRMTSASEELMKAAGSSITRDFLERSSSLASLASLDTSSLASDLGKASAISDALRITSASEELRRATSILSSRSLLDDVKGSKK